MNSRLKASIFTLGIFSLLLLVPQASAQDFLADPVTPANQCGDGHGNDLELTPGPQNIENGPCSLVCRSNTSCSFACIDDNENQSDCGDYGVCDPCKEGIVEIGRVEIGRSARQTLFYCEHVIHERVTWKSQNAGCSSFTTCEKDTVGWGVGINCCQAWGCYGQQC